MYRLIKCGLQTNKMWFDNHQTDWCQVLSTSSQKDRPFLYGSVTQTLNPGSNLEGYGTLYKITSMPFSEISKSRKIVAESLYMLKQKQKFLKGFKNKMKHMILDCIQQQGGSTMKYTTGISHNISLWNLNQIRLSI